jgi:hypothetical protein
LADGLNADDCPVIHPDDAEQLAARGIAENFE